MVVVVDSGGLFLDVVGHNFVTRVISVLPGCWRLIKAAVHV